MKLFKLWIIKLFKLWKLLKVIKEKGLSISEVIYLIGGLSEVSIDEEFNLTLDYSYGLQDMIVAGNFNLVNHSITEENFPLLAELLGNIITISAKLFHFDRDISNKDIIIEMDKADYRPANVFEILALAKTYPELQKRFPIIALGSIWSPTIDNRLICALSFDEGKRGLLLGSFDCTMGSICRFLAVRK